MKSKTSYLAAALLGITLSCGKKDDDDDSPSYDICSLKEDDETKDFTICSNEFLDSDLVDGKTCYYEICKTQEAESTGCPNYFVKTKSSSVPDEKFCSYSRPVEL